VNIWGIGALGGDGRPKVTEGAVPPGPPRAPKPVTLCANGCGKLRGASLPEHHGCGHLPRDSIYGGLRVSKTFKVLLFLVLGVPSGTLCPLSFWAYSRLHDPFWLYFGLTCLALIGLTLFIIRRPSVADDELSKRHNSPKARAAIASFGILGSIIFPLQFYLPLKPAFDQLWEPVLWLTASIAAATWLSAVNGSVVIYENEQDLAWCSVTPFVALLALLSLFIGGFFYSGLTNDSVVYSVAALLGAIFLVSLVWSIYRSTARHRNLFVGIVVGFVRVFLPLALSLFAFVLAVSLGRRSKKDATESEKLADALFFAVIMAALFAIGAAYFRALINGDEVDSFGDSSEMARTVG
jgi:cytochrome bd-type quinol oxidase subunit 2